MKKLKILLVLILPSLLTAQTNEWAYFIGFQKESIFYPSKYTFESPVHPGFTLGTEILIKDKAKIDQLLTAEIGFYHHDYLQNGLFFLTGYQFRLNPLKNISFLAQPQLGYLHTFSPSKEFRLKNGEYVVKKSGHPAAFAGVSLSIDFQLIPAYESKIYLSYRMMAEGPFAISYGVPVAPHTFISIGLKSKISSK